MLENVKRNKINHFYVLFAIVGLLVTGNPVSASIIIDTFSPDGSHNPNGWNAIARSDLNGIDARIAFEFIVSGGNYVLDSATLAISYISGGSNLTIALADDNNNQPGNVLEYLSINESIWPQTGLSSLTPGTILNSTLNPILSDGNKYWLIAEPTNLSPVTDSLYEWFINNEEIYGTVARDTTTGSGPFPGDWPLVGNTTLGTFRVEGTLTNVPVPAALYLLSSGLVGLFGIVKCRGSSA